MTFTDGITFTFGPGTTLAPGGYLVLTKASPVNDFAEFRAFYGLDPTVAITGPYEGSLANEGERLTLSHLVGGAGDSVLRLQ